MPTIESILDGLQAGRISPQDVRANGWLTSVTGRVRRTRQPAGGFLPPRLFTTIRLPGGGIDSLHPVENVHASLVGLAVDYLTRVMSGTSVSDAFHASLLGARTLGMTDTARMLAGRVSGLDDMSIRAALRLSGFDAAYRAGVDAYRPVERIRPDRATRENVRLMVERSMRFLDEYGPKVLDGLTFDGGYTGFVTSGDGDLLTSDTLWEIKTSKRGPTSEHTLQLLMYWRMGLHSIHPEYEQVRYLGVWNPRLNTVRRLDVATIPGRTILTVERDVIGYDGPLMEGDDEEQ